MKKLSFVAKVLPWFCSLFLSRNQESTLRLAVVCQELILSFENRLCTVHKSPFLKKNEVLVKCTTRGIKLINQNTFTHIAMPPEAGCDDESLKLYFKASSQVYLDELVELVEMNTKSSQLDDFFEYFSKQEEY